MSKKTAIDNIDKFHEYNIYLPTRTLYIGSEENHIEHGESGTDGAMTERVIKNLHILDTTEQQPITIYMNNLGGDEYSLFAIIDAIKKCQSHVTIIGMGHVMSAGSLILQAADKRVMAPLAVQMIHYGSWGYHDHSKTFQKWAKEGKRIDDWMEQYYLARIHEKHPNFKLKKLQEMLDHDTFLSAQESVDLGLADEVLGTVEG
jgi:ATP-dependent Clp protease protease subunit